MAELDVYLSDSEEVDFISHVFSLGLWLVPDRNYQTPEAERLATVSEYLRSRADVRQFFLLSDGYFNCPLSMGPIEKDGQTVYYVFPRDGGPAIDFLRCGAFEQDGTRWLRPGSLHYYPWYVNTTTQQNEAPPKELVGTYRKLSSWIRANATRIKPGVRAYWVGLGAQELVRQGYGLVGLEQFHVSF